MTNAHGRRHYADEVPGLLLPASARARREPRELLQEEGLDELEENEREVSTQTEPGELLKMKAKLEYMN